MATKGAAEIIAEGQATDHHVAMKALKEKSEGGWKDEVWTIAMAIPFFQAFIPPMQPWALKGFAIMSTAPTFYWALVLLCICYAFHRKVVSLYGLIRGAGHEETPK